MEMRQVATVSSGDADITTPRACVDVRDMGLLPNLLATDSIPEMRKSSWAEEVDKRMNARYSKGDPDQEWWQQYKEIETWSSSCVGLFETDNSLAALFAKEGANQTDFFKDWW
ncbi:hypothetical protein V6N13_088459 [Hibiscus sabdariffa]